MRFRICHPKQRANMNTCSGNSLMVQWLGLCTSIAGVTVSISGQETKISPAVQCGAKKKKKKKNKKTKKTLLPTSPLAIIKSFKGTKILTYCKLPS